MLKPDLYKKTVDILFQAYFANTLEHGNCCACAIGNMVAANCDVERKYPSYLSNWNPIWRDVFYTDATSKKQFFYSDAYIGDAKKQLDSTGYTLDDLRKIEFAFETASHGKSEEDYMFNGLVAVLEVLKDIHQVEDNEPDVTRFRDQYAQRACKAL